MLFGAAAVGIGAHDALTVGNYNRENWLSNLRMAQASRFHLQTLVLKQGTLFREDIRCLIAHALATQSNFLLLTTLLANIVVKLYSGGMKEGAAWDIRLFNLTACSSLVFLLSAMYYVLWAHTNTATCEREMLTTTMRLPIEDLKDELDEITAAGLAEGWEKDGVSKMLRIPGLARLLHGDKATDDDLAARPALLKEQEHASAGALKIVNRMKRETLEKMSHQQYEWHCLSETSTLFAKAGVLSLLCCLACRSMDYKTFSLSAPFFQVVAGLLAYSLLEIPEPGPDLRRVSWGEFRRDKGRWQWQAILGGLVIVAAPALDRCAIGFRVAHIAQLIVHVLFLYRYWNLYVVAIASHNAQSDANSHAEDTDEEACLERGVTPRKVAPFKPFVGRNSGMGVIFLICSLWALSIVGEYFDPRGTHMQFWGDRGALFPPTEPKRRLTEALDSLDYRVNGEVQDFLFEQGVSSLEDLREITREDIDVALGAANLRLGSMSAVRKIHKDAEAFAKGPELSAEVAAPIAE